MSDFEDKVVVITGAGGGLGKAHALEFARRGARVVVNDLGGSGDGVGSSDAADIVVEEIKAAGGDAIANKASVSSKEGAQSIIDDAVGAYGTVDILVNNAGILRDKSFKNMNMADWDMVMDVHLNGSGYVTRAAWPIMYEKNYGRIVFTSSTSGVFGNFGQANYGAAKMGMLGLMNVLSIEGLSKNIRVNCLAPAAETRLIGTIPGRDVDPDNPDPMRHPRLVTPVVLLMCAEDAPTGQTFHAGNGRFSRSATFVNKALEFGADVTFEDLQENRDQLIDMSSSREMSGLIRVMRQSEKS
ncbi:MAG: SDR family NAD(P)-dependent oxidoreductase [Gammaproteobacteria bacterium]|jgi:NAD(P)-dependent dehydrogenase (short-subunit alcohol dehydrogenase family)|nr:SDR family NAD(P)-dependent oxidoreductase [Gammaproteobacteria bacterium]MBT5683997.1 SDR family NAD(P)-dependent oxidoreductase [Gammaproteobacteria bacterium]MBT5722751.1 SDR family NAD(P)-dependent oxidoreductase [Gammaproteobacteria bacterium]MBT6586165.1 SDR family NAD(P)-dependent oxidoreductase [Gammaproteobacteria bacterium]MBT6893428.1 SDR family NAD(P)-dependent oxidoreductase [Gammaproteobacteria bacterium]